MQLFSFQWDEEKEKKEEKEEKVEENEEKEEIATTMQSSAAVPHQCSGVVLVDQGNCFQ